MPRLLQINCTSNWGSTGKIVEAINIVAQRNGWESFVAYGRYQTPSSANVIKIGTKLDNVIQYVLHRLLDREGLGSVKATKILIKRINQISPDVIQLHNIHDHYLNYRILFEYLNQSQIKVVWTFHDCWAFTGHCYHFVEAGCKKWQRGCGDCPLRYPICDRSSENYLLKKKLFTSDFELSVVSVSEWMASLVRNSFLRSNKIRVIYNGIDLDIFKPSVSKINDGKFRIIAVSNVWPKSKGLEDIVKLRGMLSSEFEITVVGLNAKQISLLPLGIIGIQRTQNVHDLVHLYSISDVLINTSYADTFPTVNLEALACGTPVITYRTGGAPEAIDEKTGFVVQQGDIIALAQAIRKTKDNPFLKEDCRKRAEECFDQDKCYNKYFEIYEQLLVK